MKTILTNVKTFTQDKDGNPLKTRDGKPYTRLNIQTKSHGDRWISGFGNSRNRNWAAGEEVDIEVKENGQYLNFEMPKPVVMGGMDEVARNQLIGIQMDISQIKTALASILALLQTKPEDTEDVEMPFGNFDGPLPEENN